MNSKKTVEEVRQLVKESPEGVQIAENVRAYRYPDRENDVLIEVTVGLEKQTFWLMDHMTDWDYLVSNGSDNIRTYGRAYRASRVLASVTDLSLSEPEETTDASGGDVQTLREQVSALEGQVAEEEVRAEEFEREKIRAEGNYEGMRAAFEVLTQGRQVTLGE